MSKPNLEWRGSVEKKEGSADIHAGAVFASVPFACCSYALIVQNLLDEAYKQGWQDGQYEFRRTIERAMGG